MKKTCTLLLAALMLFGLLVACNGEPAATTAPPANNSEAPTTMDDTATPPPADPDTPPPEPVELTIVYATGDQTGVELMHERVLDFMAENQHVTLVEKLGSSELAYLDHLQTLDAVNELPDIIEMRNMPQFARAGKIGELPGDIMNLFDSPIGYNGIFYTAPIVESYPNGIVYSKKIFDDLGIKVEDIKVYNDFLDVCQKIKDSGVAPIVVGGSDIWHIGFWWSYFWRNEVSVNNPNWLSDKYEGKVSFTDANVKAAMEGLNDLFHRGFIEEGWASTAEATCPSILVSGQAAMYYIGSFAFSQITEADPDFEFGFFALPDKNGKYNITGGPTAEGWAINAETQKDPAKAAVVYDFINYFFRTDVYTDFVTRYQMLPTLKENITFSSTEQFNETMRISEIADDKQLNWNLGVGNNEMPPNFRNYCYKLVSEWFMDVSTLEDGLAAMDAEWITCTQDFNPVIGLYPQ